MRILVVGSGGREHALAWKAARCEGVETVYVAPGNAGTAAEPGVQNVSLGAEDVNGLADFARNYHVDLTIVGPEAPLVAGVADAFARVGLRCFGVGRDAAELEASKSFAKAFLERHAIPTAAYRSFLDAEEARDYIREHGAPVVVKADGLAAGKGVVVASTLDEALNAVDALMPPDAGERIVVEDFLEGEELSFIAMVNGEAVLPLASSQDHKARDDGDSGPNTGGMGACSPAPLATTAMQQRIMSEIIGPTLRGLAQEGIRFTGFLYAGLMVDGEGQPRVLEFNVRLGDPEAQSLLMRLRSDLVALCNALLDERVEGLQVDWDPRPCVGVVMASGGYPEGYDRGFPITGLDADAGDADVKVFHAGTALDSEGRVVNSGGRVLCVCALDESVTAARARAYRRVERIHWEGEFHRGDIGHLAVARERGERG